MGTGGGGSEGIKCELQRRCRVVKDGKDTADKCEHRAQQGAVWLHQNRPEISQLNNGLATSCGPTFGLVKDVFVPPPRVIREKACSRGQKINGGLKQMTS